MATRGSTCPHKKTPNPFMLTSSSRIGLNLKEPIEFNAPAVNYSNFNGGNTTRGVVEYMYQTSSTMIGEGICKEKSRMSQLMDKFTVRKGLIELYCFTVMITLTKIQHFP